MEAPLAWIPGLTGGPQAADLDGGAALPPAPAVGLLFDLLPDDLLVGEVAAGLAVVHIRLSLYSNTVYTV